jgi:2-dehydropantoate 2-reductase
MKVVILGAGGLGSVVGGYLARAGVEVTLVARPAHVAAIRERGLHVAGMADFVVRVEATADPADLRQADYLLLTTKTRDSDAALDAARHLDVGCAASLQNGVVKDEQLAARWGWERVIGATSIVGATLVGPGEVRHTLDGTTWFGEFDGHRSQRVTDLVDAFNAAGLRTEIPANIRSAEWSKLCQICSAATLSAISRLNYHRLLLTPDWAWLFVAITREVASVARAAGVEVGDYAGFNPKTLDSAPFDQAVEMIVQRGKDLEAHGRTGIKISMLQDVEARKLTEIEALAGYVVTRGRELNVATPAIEFAYHAVRGIEATYS